MKKLEFSTLAGFPASTETWRFIQEMIEQLQQLSLLGGQNYIISGCEEGGGVAAAGWVVINGEVLPFEGGAVQPKVIVVDEPVNRAFFGGANLPYYHNRKVIFGAGAGEVAWNTFESNNPANGVLKRIKTLEENLAALDAEFDAHVHSYNDLADLPAAKIVYKGSQPIGNIGTTGGNPDSIFTIPIPDQPDANYRIIGTMRGLNADLNIENDVSWVVGVQTINSFKLGVREYAAATQNLVFDFIILY